MAKKRQHKDELKDVAEARLIEFDLLRRNQRYAAAVYLSGYVIENYLKRSICLKMNLDELPPIFHVHDLKELLEYSGLLKDAQQRTMMYENFEKYCGLWFPALRYASPGSITQTTCDTVHNYFQDPNNGFVPYLKGNIP
jgi:hypothetical protein